MELAEAIWQLCDNGGVHTDAILCAKVEDYVDQCINGTVKPNDPIKRLFKEKYGYVRKGNTLVQDHAVSIITKYLFFLLKVNSKRGVGFPIYDTIVKNQINRIAKKLGLGSVKNLKDVANYVKILYEIIRALGTRYQNLCKQYGMQEFELLDFFLWRVGKLKKRDYSNLLSKQEYITNTTPQWIYDVTNKIKTIIP